MRGMFVRCVFIALLAGSSVPAAAGNQKEIALADSVRVALSRAISDTRPPKPLQGSPRVFDEFPPIVEN